MYRPFNEGDLVMALQHGVWVEGTVIGSAYGGLFGVLTTVKNNKDGSIFNYRDKELKHIDVIDSFTGEYSFLSNFYEPAYVIIDGHFFTNSEAAFHSYKCPDRIGEFTILGPKDAKRLGRTVKLRPDWDDIKDDVMYNVCFLKFTQNNELTNKLLATEFDTLIEGNTWGDTYLGVCDGEGENHLGKILMEVRENIRNANYKLRDIPDPPNE